MSTRISFRTPPTRLLAVGFLAFSLVLGCDKAGGGSAGPGDGPPKPAYESPSEEIGDIPNQMGAQVQWAAQPIEDVATLGNEVAALKANLNIDSAKFESMCKVAFTDGTIEVGADAELQAARTEIEATLGKIKQAGVDLKGIPGRVKVAGKNIAKMVTSTPMLAMKATKDLKGQLSVATGDDKVKIEADLKALADLPAAVKAEAVELKTQLSGLPKQAAESTKNLMASFTGKPMPEGSGAPAAAADPAAGAAPAPAGSAPAPAPAPATAAAPAPAPAAAPAPDARAVPPPPSGGTPPPAAVAAAAPTPAASAPAIRARLAVLESEAKQVSGHGDWKTAADLYAEAYYLDPANHVLAFKIGQAAWNAKDCTLATEYLNHFTQHGQAGHDAEAAKAAAIQKELRTFECPPRTTEDEAALAQTMLEEGRALGEGGDWGGAAASFAAAYQVVPEDHSFAYEVAFASWNAKECGDASTYFTHFLGVADSKAHRRQIREANKYQAKADECTAMSATEKDAHARALYSQAQNLEQKLEYKRAVGKYERAHFLMPGNHAFLFRIADAAWNAKECEQADEYVRKFATNATDPRYATDLALANGMIAKLDAHGCPNALWATGSGAGSAPPDPGAAGGAATEGPPPSGETAGAKSCSVAPTSGVPALWCLIVLAARRRRKD